MCDSDENYLTILNEYIPNILQNLKLEYVVKGGRSFDYYLYLENGEKMIYLTDWDIACYAENIEEIKNIIMSYIEEKSLKLMTENITTNDNKKGIQIGIEPNKCFFIDLVTYDKDNEIFKNITIGNDNIKYVNKQYMLNDLRNTYEDRRKNIIEGLEHYGINQFNFVSLNDDLSNIQSILFKKINDKQTFDIKKYETNYSSGNLDSEEYEEIKEELNERFINNVESLYNETIPEIKNILSKFYRTKNRYNKLYKNSGGKKISKITNKLKKNFRKRRTVKKR